MCNERDKALITVVMSIRNRMKLMSQKTQEEVTQLISLHNITATDIIEKCVEMNYSV